MLTMLNRKQVLARSLAVLAGPALLLIVGCSDDGLAKRYAVSGTVKYKGEPVAKARISFVPKDAAGRGASGDVENGSFSLSTLSPGDGALPGEYKVTVDEREVDEAALKADTAKTIGKKNKGDLKIAMPIPELQAKALKKAKSSIPGKYQIDATSDLTAKVEEKSNKFEFELKD
jgi:hypothetical protein